LPRGDKGALRAHLRECGECATFARRLRAQRSALKALAAVPIPGSLASFFGGTSVGSGVVVLKAGAIAATFVAAGAATSVGVKHSPWQNGHRHAAAAPSALAHAPSTGAGRARSSSAIDKSSRIPIAGIVVRTKPTRPAPVTRARTAPAPTHSGSNGDQAQSESHGRSSNDQGGHDNSSPAQRKLDNSHDGDWRGGGSPKSDQGGGGGGSGGGGGDSSGDHSGGGDKHGGGGGQSLPNLSLPQAPVDVSDALPKKASARRVRRNERCAVGPRCSPRGGVLGRPDSAAIRALASGARPIASERPSHPDNERRSVKPSRPQVSAWTGISGCRTCPRPHPGPCRPRVLGLVAGES